MYGFVIVALFQSNLYWLIQLLIVFSLSAYFIFLWCIEAPGAICSQIQYLDSAWHVSLKHQSVECYHSARVRFDFGWLMWIVFNNPQETGKSATRHVLIFQDQLSKDDSRLLRVVLRLRPN